MTEDADVPTEEFETDWQNYGDVNPEPHGGRFVRWDDDFGQFDIVGIDRAGAISPDFEDEPGQYFVRECGVQLSDIWVDGDPENGFTDEMENILESLSDEHHKQAPGGEPFLSRIEYYVADMLFQIGDSQMNQEEGDFEDVLARYDVEEWE